MKILSYDVETANSKIRGSICSIGWVLLENSTVINKGYTLINPLCEFSSFNSRFHGITPEAVMSAPTFREYWESTLGNLMSNALVIAHNAGFDIHETLSALDRFDIDDPGIEYFDTLAGIRAYNLSIESHKLSDLAAMAGYKYQAHHAGEDTEALVYVLLSLCKQLNIEDIPALLIRSHVPAQSTSTRKYDVPVISASQREESLSYTQKVNKIIEEAKDKGVVFDDIHFCFHGDLINPEIPRKHGLDMIVESLGGVFHDSVSGKVDFYVCFDDEETGTVTKAKCLAENPKCHLHIIKTDDFLELLGYDTDEPNLDDPALIRIRKRNEREAAEREAEEAQRAREEKKARRAEKVAHAAESASKFRILQFSYDGSELIKEHKNVASAAREIGVDKSCIRDAAKGRQKHAGGFTWKYADDLPADK